MSESRDHHCPRCGAYLPTVIVQKPVYEKYMIEGHREMLEVLLRYEDVEEVADCVRCTGGY